MATPNLPTDITAGQTTGHADAHETIHEILNVIDESITEASEGDALVADTNGVFKPTALGSAAFSDDEDFASANHDHDADYANISHTHDYSELLNKPSLGTAAQLDVEHVVRSGNSSVAGIEFYDSTDDLPAEGTVGVIYVVPVEAE